jgi:hypothetical protein
MTEEIRLWRIDRTGMLMEIQRNKLSLEDRLEQWILNDITILSDNLLIIGEQVQTLGGPLDILCLDSNGDTVIVELKRGMTPREVTAQALDYASCIKDMTAENLDAIAKEFFMIKNGASKSLAEEFEQRFGVELPDDINQRQRIIIVGANIDDSTERIIHYLSENYDIPINALTFQYFKNDGDEYLGRVFLLDPEVIESKMGKTGTRKRTPYLKYDELVEIAKENNVLELYTRLWEGLRNIFSGTATNVSSLTFNVISENGRNIVMGLVPTDSDEGRGLKFYLYAKRLTDFIGISREDLIAALPVNKNDWCYTEANRGNEFWSGYEGYFSNMEEVNRFIEKLLRSKQKIN